MHGRKQAVTVAQDVGSSLAQDAGETPAHHSRAHASAVSRDGVIRAYRRYAPIYDCVFGAVLSPGRKAMGALVRTLQPTSALEVGVGTGLTLEDYPPDCSLCGIDVCEDMLALAQRRAKALHPRNIDLRVMDAEALGFPDHTFDCVTVPYVLSVTPNPERLVAEVRRVCRKGGTIIILNHFSGSRFWRRLEPVVQGVAEKIGFRSQFPFETHVLGHDWEVLSVRTVNLFGLSRLVTIRNT